MRHIFTSLFVLVTLCTLAQPAPTSKTTDKFKLALGYLQTVYVDTVNQEQLTEAAIKGMLKKLDPHTTYLTAKEIKDANEPLQGNFEGIGITFNIINDTVTVVSATTGGPSEKLGILPGDKIIYVDTTLLSKQGLTDNKVIKSLRGAKGTEVLVKIYRRGNKQLIPYKIVRDKIPIYSLDAGYMIDSETGYIKINRFSASTMTEFKTALTDLRGQGLKNLVLDLQGNSGGYLQTAIDLCDEFLGNNKLIVYTQGKNSPRNESFAKPNGMFENGKLLVLIDEGSASASEIFAGAIQDHDRGIVVGRRSFGKGLVQNTYLLGDGSAMRITTAKYFTPAGRCIQRSYKDGVEAYYKDLRERYKKGELTTKDSIHVENDSLKYYTDNKRTVYGGGGIMPDFFVPLDTTFNTEYLTAIYNKGGIRIFSNNYVDRNREAMKVKYPSFEDYKRSFVVDDKLLDEFTAYMAKEGVEKNTEQLAISLPTIKIQMKAIIGSLFFKSADYYPIINELNRPLQKALELLKDGTFDKMGIAYTGE